MKIKRINVIILVLVPVVIVFYFMIRSSLSEILRPVLLILVDILYPVGFTIPYPFNLFGLFLAIPGFMLIVWANYTLTRKISWTEREPFHTPSALVVEGPFKYSRNPVYLSVIIIFSGISILIGSLTLLLAPLALFIIFRLFFISWEEKKLEETFGKDYLDFKKRVRRWL
ncbi:MAG: methyltransferase family protein [Candidatus Hodarchaeales archaeon]|jgi:protein-S-isoprenylcysteine O-methyltransferase Ste14